MNLNLNLIFTSKKFINRVYPTKRYKLEIIKFFLKSNLSILISKVDLDSNTYHIFSFVL